MKSISIDQRQYLEVEKLAFGSFYPLTKFMDKEMLESVGSDMRLPTGEIFPIPVVFDVTEEDVKRLRIGDQLRLMYGQIQIGNLHIEDIFCCNKRDIAEKIFGTVDPLHPGMAHFLKLNEYFVSGPVKLINRVAFGFSHYEYTPQETKDYFKKNNWKKIVGFQTRNVPHRAHEYLLRMGLEIGDGLFIQPLVGRKKNGDYTPEAILTAYETLIEKYLPRERILLGVLSTEMRYAGPREAIFHAIIRRNYGCTHFIIGRDHAGVKNYYGKYEAHELARKFEDELGIEILYCSGPYYCSICDGIVSERTCPHRKTRPEVIQEINGTDMRKILSQQKQCPDHLMRPEVIESINKISHFIEED